jgi:hypothetical protein
MFFNDVFPPIFGFSFPAFEEGSSGNNERSNVGGFPCLFFELCDAGIL